MKRVGRTITPEVLRAFPRAMLASHPSRTRCDRFLEKHGLCGHFRVMYQVMSHRFPPHMRCASLSLSRGRNVGTPRGRARQLDRPRGGRIVDAARLAEAVRFLALPRLERRRAECFDLRQFQRGASGD